MLCGGGTGGHVFPLVAVAREIKKLAPETKIYFVGPEEFSLDCLREEGVTVKRIIAAGKMRSYFSLLYLWELIKLPFAFIQSFLTVAFINPDVVLGKGSYGSVLPVLCTWLLGKKIILHDSDAIPGKANKFLSKFANDIAVSFEEAAQYFPGKKIYHTGNPVRLKFLGLTKPEAEKILNFSSEKSVIFIGGGSQGAQRINNIILESLSELRSKYFIVWSVGLNNLSTIENAITDKKDLKLVGLLDEKELAAVYTLCDIAVGRAGAGTIFEVAAFGAPSILIPLERRGGDQPLNAQAYANSGAAVVLKEPGLTKDSLLGSVGHILASREELSIMSQNARKFAKIEAGRNLAKILLDLAK